MWFKHLLESSREAGILIERKSLPFWLCSGAWVKIGMAWIGIFEKVYPTAVL